MKRTNETDLAPIVGDAGANQLSEIVGEAGGIRCSDLSIAKTILTDGGRVESHFHKRSIEVYLITSGAGTMTVADDEFVVGPGAVVLIEPDESHELVAHRDADLEFYAISQPAWLPEDHLTGADPS